MVDTFTPPSRFDTGEKGTIYGLYRRPIEYHIKAMRPDGEEIRIMARDSLQSHIIARFVGGGLVEHNGMIYLVLVTSPFIYRFTTEGEPLGKIGYVPEDYRTVEGDMAGGTSPRELSQQIDDLSGDKSLTIELFALSDSTLLLQYWNRYQDNEVERTNSGYVISMDGKIRTVHFRMKRPFIYAGHGRAYRRIPPSQVRDTVANAVFRVYQFRAE